MKNRMISCVLAVCAAARIVAAPALPGPGSQPVVPLWPAGAPGSEARKDEPEQVEAGNMINVHFPTITVYLPAKDRATGCGVIVCPGGSHRFLVVQKEGYDIARWLADHGIAAFVLKYRLSRDDATPMDIPQPYTLERDELADAQQAFRLVRSRAAEWGVVPARLGILGFSAGGELAALAAMHPEPGEPDAPDPVDRMDTRPSFLVLVYPGQTQKIAPVPGAPPAFLACGADDRPDISEGLSRVYLLYKQAGVPVELHIYAGVGHGFALRPGPAAGWADQLRTWLVGQRFIPAPAPGAGSTAGR